MAKGYAVIIADVVGSSARKDLRATLGKKVEMVAREHLQKGWIKLPYAITAGDEFQAIVAKGASVPKVIFDLRMRFWPLHLRIGIGVGRVKEKIQRPVNRMGGEAFQRARQAIEAIKNEHPKYEVLTEFRTENEEFDATANLIYVLQDTLLMERTLKQWDTILAYYVVGEVRRTAKRLRQDKSTVSRSLRRGFFWQMRDTVQGMERLIRAEGW